MSLASLARNALTLAETLPARARGAIDVLTQDPAAPANLVAELDARARATPDRTFLLFERERYTYRELASLVGARARTLASKGVGRGDVVALMMSNHPRFLVNAWAIAKLGAVASLVNTQLSLQGLAHGVVQTSPKLLVAGREHLPQLYAALADEPRAKGLAWLWEETRAVPGDEPTREAESLSELDARLSVQGAPIPATAVTFGDELYAFISTSGTTGLPKAGKITHARARTAASGFGQFTLGLGERDVVYVCLPLFHSSGFLIGAGGALRSGATLALARKLSIRRFWDDVCDHGATAFVYIGEVCRYLLQAPPHPRERAHRLTRIVGNGMRPDVWRGFVERFDPGLVLEFYGATEGNVNMTNLLGVEGSVGRMPPLPWLDNAQLVRFDRDRGEPVRDARGRCVPCEPGEEGELLGRIDPHHVTMRFEGYLGDAATSSKILRDVLAPGDAFFRSGDLLRRDRLGFYYFVDRIGETYRWKGENVSATEVADACMRHEGVELASVYGVRVPGADGRAGMAALSLRAGAHFAPDRFYSQILGDLPSYAAPLFVRLLPEQAVTATFKLKKSDLERDGFDPRAVADLVFIRNDAARTYEPLDAAVYDAIARGARRLG